MIEHYRSIQSQDGDEEVRGTLLAARAVTRDDHQMTKTDQARLLTAFDEIEAELLPNK